MVRPRATSCLPRGVPRPQRLEVIIECDADAVVARVLASRARPVAVRVWELRPGGYRGVLSVPVGTRLSRP